MLPGNGDFVLILEDGQGLAEFQTERIPSDVGEGSRAAQMTRAVPFSLSQSPTTRTDAVSSWCRRRDF